MDKSCTNSKTDNKAVAHKIVKLSCKFSVQALIINIKEEKVSNQSKDYNQPIITQASIKYVVKPPFVTLLRSEKVTSKTK